MIGFCSDLTDPEATAIPIAVLVIGGTDEERLAAIAATVPGTGDDYDPITFELLAIVPEVIRDQLDRFRLSIPASPRIADLLSALQARLRENVCLLEISPEESMDVELGPRLPWQLADRLQQIACAAHAKARAKVSAPLFSSGLPARALWPLTGTLA